MVAIGLDEKDGDRLYDTAILMDKSGKMLWKHRKINVLPELMTPPYSQGRPDDIGVVETEFGRIAVLICADTFTDAFVERLKALKPDLMLVPYGWAAANDKWPEHSRELEELVKRRAAQMRCPMAGVDLVGEMTHGPWSGWTYGGSSLVVDGEGRILFIARDRDTDLHVIDLAESAPTGKPDRTPFWENFRFADNPPGTPRTGQSRLNECFGLKSPVELKKRSLGSSVADSGFSNRPRTGAASDRELHVSNTRQKGSTDMRLEKRLHIYSS